jgi:hypothetical protein
MLEVLGMLSGYEKVDKTLVTSYELQYLVSGPFSCTQQLSSRFACETINSVPPFLLVQVSLNLVSVY